MTWEHVKVMDECGQIAWDSGTNTPNYLGVWNHEYCTIYSCNGGETPLKSDTLEY